MPIKKKAKQKRCIDLEATLINDLTKKHKFYFIHME